MRRIGAMVAGIGTVISTVLHVTFGMNAGALWRDEINSLSIATMGTFSELWSYLTFDSFPALFFILLRAFAGFPAADSDTGLRIFGVAIGLLVIAVLWLNSRWLRFGFPLISLALIGFNPLVIRYGDSIRAYGLGMVLLLLSLGTIWRLVEKASPGRFLAALASAVLSVQCLYYNSFLLFAICVGAVAVSWRRREYQRIFMILGIGGIAATSMLVYWSTIRRVEATQFFWKFNFTAELFWIKLSETLGSPLASFAWLWVALCAGAIIAGSWQLCRRPQTRSSGTGNDAILFALVTLLVGSVGYFGFLFHLSYETQPWYYVVFVAFAATCLEIIFASLPGKQWGFRTGFAILCIGLTAQPAWAALQFRQTNVDVIASRLESLASPRDFIVINTWNFGITFRHYYRGAANWTTVPPMGDLRVHRMDMVYQQLRSSAPMAPVLLKMEETLRQGNTIWLIGALEFVAPGEIPRRNVRGSRLSFSERAGLLVRVHAEELERVSLSLKQPVVHHENIPLSAIRGWHDSGALTVR
ncbi:MAG: hypothetical protein M3Q46_04555 [Verrucomicrobiota bacterium]|nr:hypothetical protein [Verrucomicrobiota bacterium]